MTDTLPDTGTIKLGGGSAGHVDAATERAMNAALAARTTLRYPKGWPAKLRPALDATRELLRSEDGTPLFHGTWCWHKTTVRTFVLEVDGDRWEGKPEELPDHLWARLDAMLTF